MQLHEIPYIRQEDVNTCGAAALCMVYASFGVDVNQITVFRAIKNTDSLLRLPGASVHKMTQHFIEHGFSALLLQAANSWQTLRQSFRPSLRFIILHRRGFGTGGVHSSVLRGINDRTIILHDPFDRPDRELNRELFALLWGPSNHWSPALHHLLIVVKKREGITGESSTRLASNLINTCVGCGASLSLEEWDDFLQPGHWTKVICSICGEQSTIADPVFRCIS